MGVDVAYYFRGDGNNVSYAGTTVGDPQFLGSLQSAEFFRRTADGQATGDAVGFADVTLSGSGSFYEFEHRGDRYLTTGTTLSRDQAGTQVQSGFLVVMSPLPPSRRPPRARCGCPVSAVRCSSSASSAC